MGKDHAGYFSPENKARSLVDTDISRSIFRTPGIIAQLLPISRDQPNIHTSSASAFIAGMSQETHRVLALRG